MAAAPNHKNKSAAPKEMDATECDQKKVDWALKMFNTNVLRRLPGGTQSRPHEIVACQFQMILGSHKIFRVKVDFAGETCDFDLIADVTAENPQKPLIYSRKTLIREKHEKILADLQEQANKCQLPSYTPSYDHPGIKPEGATPCKEGEEAGHLKTFVDWVSVPDVTLESFTVKKCYIQKRNHAQTLELVDGRGNEVTVSMYVSPVNGKLLVVSDPEDYVDFLSYLRAHPRHPGRVDAPKEQCTGDEIGKYLEVFTEYLQNETISVEQFDIQSCTIQNKDGRIVNMDLKYNSEAFGQQTPFISMYIATPGAQPAVITNENKLLNALRRRLDDPEASIDEFKKYAENIDYDSLLTEHDREKNGLMGGWNSQEDCKWVKDFATFIGLDENYFDGVGVANCETQVVNGVNVRFTLFEKGDDKLLLGNKDVRVTGYYPAVQGAYSFSAIPENFIDQLRAEKKIVANCSDEEKRAFASQYTALAESVSLRHPYVFVENIKNCQKTKNRIEVVLSFNRRACSLAAAVQSDVLVLQSTDCERSVAML